jgi:hypothetical protein
MGMADAESAVGTAENYRRFAEREAAGRSPAYERLAFAVADDELILGFLDGLPRAKRQPNLLFAAARLVLGETPTIESLSELVASRADELATTMRARRTQTNEAARCATLLPALATIPGPVVLIEVGASAGLCLQLDRYSYDYGSIRLAGTDPGAPVLRCELCGSTPVPLTMPDVAWRAGLDLNPLDPANPEDREWLRCLVWPGQSERLIDELGVRWLSNEAAEVLPGTTPLRRDDSAFVLALDTEPIALTHPHGDWIEWFS